MRFLLDTNVLSAAVAKQPSQAVLDQLSAHAAECAVPAPVWHELTYGVRRLPRGKRRTSLETYLSEVVHPVFPILPYDEAAAALHARERARLERRGRSVPFVDGQIAAIARSRQLVLVTNNVRDFRRFDELELVDWTKPP